MIFVENSQKIENISAVQVISGQNGVITHIQPPFQHFSFKISRILSNFLFFSKMSDIKPCVHDSFSEVLDSPEFLRRTLHIIVLIGLPIHIFGGFCIIFKTPVQMANMKWVMLNLHLWSVALDISFSVLVVPYLYTPVLAGYSLGVLQDFGVRMADMYYLTCVLIAGLLISVALLFETRFFILYARESFWRHLRRPWLILNYLIAATYMIPTYIAIPEQQYGKWFQFRRYPCLPPEVYDEKVFILTTWSTGVAYNMSLNTAVQQAIIFVILTYWNMKKSIGQVKLSKKTMDMHRKFLRALVLQVSNKKSNVVLATYIFS